MSIQLAPLIHESPVDGPTARASAAERAARAQSLARSVRGTPIELWPRSWSLDEALAAAMWLGLEPDGLAVHLRALGFRVQSVQRSRRQQVTTRLED